MLRWFLSFFLLICCIVFNDLWVLSHSCIPGMKRTWSWCMIFLICCPTLVCQYFIENFCT
jgi:hypothetical protein